LLFLLIIGYVSQKEWIHGQSTKLLYTTNINTEGIEDVPFISQDGNRLYFHYTIYNLLDLKRGQKTIIGPLRRGHSLNDFRKCYFLGCVAEKRDNIWQEPLPIHFENKHHAWGSVDISSDGKHMYTIGPGKTNEPTDRMDIYMHQLEDETWVNPTWVQTINTKYVEDDPDISKNNTLLVWDSDRPDGFGMRDIWYSVRLPNGQWSNPKNIGKPINSEYNEQYPFITEDGNRMYFNRAIPSEVRKGIINIFMSQRINDQWTEPIVFDLGVNIALSPSLTSDERTMYFEVGAIRNGNPSTLFDGNIDIYYSTKQSDESWSKAVPVD